MGLRGTEPNCCCKSSRMFSGEKRNFRIFRDSSSTFQASTSRVDRMIRDRLLSITTPPTRPPPAPSLLQIFFSFSLSPKIRIWPKAHEQVKTLPLSNTSREPKLHVSRRFRRRFLSKVRNTIGDLTNDERNNNIWRTELLCPLLLRLTLKVGPASVLWKIYLSASPVPQTGVPDVRHSTFESSRLGRSSQSITVGLLRFWDSLNFKKDIEFIGITFILAGRANHYKPSLKVGSIVKVDRFEVARCSNVVGQIRSVQSSDLTKETSRVVIRLLIDP
ncbi:hypothetical protein YC2023_040450 [Brassica napus]